MSQTKKPRKKAYKPKPISQNPIKLAMYKAANIAKAEGGAVTTALLKMLTARNKLRQGQADEIDVNELVDVHNLALQLCADGICQQQGQGRIICKQAKAALESVVERANRIQRFGPHGDELKALNNLLDYHELQLNTASINQFLRSLEKVHAQIKSGHTDKLKTPEFVKRRIAQQEAA
jgi:hypothetical protein